MDSDIVVVSLNVCGWYWKDAMCVRLVLSRRCESCLEGVIT